MSVVMLNVVASCKYSLI